MSAPTIDDLQRQLQQLERNLTAATAALEKVSDRLNETNNKLLSTERHARRSHFAVWVILIVVLLSGCGGWFVSRASIESGAETWAYVATYAIFSAALIGSVFAFLKVLSEESD